LPFRAFPFQKSVPLSRPLLPCGWSALSGRLPISCPVVELGSKSPTRLLRPRGRRSREPALDRDLARGWEINSRSQDVGVSSASKLYSSWKSVHAAGREFPPASAAALLSFFPSRVFSLPASDLVSQRVQAPEPTSVTERRLSSSLVLGRVCKPESSLATPGPQSLKSREDWLVPLGTACSSGVSHLVGSSRLLGVATTRGYRFPSGEGDRLRITRTHL
jgi:hypothetical protein